jgi:uncharacterized protein
MLTGSLVAAFLVGLLGGVHCVGMCGGIVGTLTAGLPANARSSLAHVFPYQLAYNGGRIAGYTLAGALMGTLGTLTIEAIPLHYAQRTLYTLAAAFMILLGRRLLPIRSPSQAVALGFVWAWIPCGLVYSVLIWSVSSGSAIEGALLMLAFGLGTLPNLLTLGMLAGAAARFADHSRIRQVSGALVIGFGLYALWQLR